MVHPTSGCNDIFRIFFICATTRHAKLRDQRIYSTIQRTKQAIYEIPILIIPRETIFFVYYYFCQQKYAKNDINHFIYIHVYLFFTMCTVESIFSFRFFPVSPSDSIRHECITLHDDVIALSDSPFHMLPII